MLTTFSFSEASSSRKVTQTQSASSAVTRSRIRTLRKSPSLALVVLNSSFKMKTLAGVASSKSARSRFSSSWSFPASVVICSSFSKWVKMRSQR